MWGNARWISEEKGKEIAERENEIRRMTWDRNSYRKPIENPTL